MPDFSVPAWKRQFVGSISSRLVPIIRERFIRHDAGQNIKPGILVVRAARAGCRAGIDTILPAIIGPIARQHISIIGQAYFQADAPLSEI